MTLAVSGYLDPFTKDLEAPPSDITGFSKILYLLLALLLFPAEAAVWQGLQGVYWCTGAGKYCRPCSHAGEYAFGAAGDFVSKLEAFSCPFQICRRTGKGPTELANAWIMTGLD
jgi:hypothetical protein